MVEEKPPPPIILPPTGKIPSTFINKNSSMGDPETGGIADSQPELAYGSVHDSAKVERKGT